MFSLCFNLGDLELRPSTFLIIDPLLGLLKIQETQDLDAGDYMCVAVNDAGRAAGKITLDVGCKHPALIDTFGFFHANNSETFGWKCLSERTNES